MDDFQKDLTETLTRAKERRERLLRELAVTDHLIKAQEEALALYQEGGNLTQATGKKTRALHGEKSGLIITALKSVDWQTTGDVFEKVKEHGVDRNYVAKILYRAKKNGQARYKDGKYHWTG